MSVHEALHMSKPVKKSIDKSILSCLILSYLISSYLILSYIILSYLCGILSILSMWLLGGIVHAHTFHTGGLGSVSAPGSWAVLA